MLSCKTKAVPIFSNKKNLKRNNVDDITGSKKALKAFNLDDLKPATHTQMVSVTARATAAKRGKVADKSSMELDEMRRVMNEMSQQLEEKEREKAMQASSAKPVRSEKKESVKKTNSGLEESLNIIASSASKIDPETLLDILKAFYPGGLSKGTITEKSNVLKSTHGADSNPFILLPLTKSVSEFSVEDLRRIVNATGLPLDVDNVHHKKHLVEILATICSTGVRKFSAAQTESLISGLKAMTAVDGKGKQTDKVKTDLTSRRR
jgi:FKBP-type peptidyl-prolyl cis-trans isomerase